MNEPDFSGIDPLRVPEARRRVAAIERYLLLESPTSADTQKFAQTVGLSRVQFTRLARVWRDHRNAKLLVIGKRGASTRKYNVDDRAVTVSQHVIAEFGAAATLRKVAPEIERQCAEMGIAPPARSTINNYIRTARAATMTPVEGPPRVVVGRMWFHLPMVGMPASAMPTLLAAVLLPEKFIIAHEVSLDPLTPPSVGRLIGSLVARQTADAPSRRLLLDPDDRRVGADALTDAGLGRTRSHSLSVQRELSKAFAGRLGPLEAIFQRSMARPGTKRISRQDEPIPAAQAMKVIEAAVATHNEALQTELSGYTLEPVRG